jgi:hypothetical protein
MLESGMLDGYATQHWVEEQGYLTEHQPLDDYATKAAVNEALGEKLDKTVFDDLFEKITLSDGSHAIKAKYGLYSVSFISAAGINSDMSAGVGASYIRLDDWADYDSSKAGNVLSAALGYDLYTTVGSNTSDISALTAKVAALEEAGVSGCVRSVTTGTDNGSIAVDTGGTTIDVYVKGLGSAAYYDYDEFAEFSHNHDWSYLKLAGGTLTGPLTVNDLLTVKTGATMTGIKVGYTYITARDKSLVFQNNTAIRFGGSDWNWDKWAGLAYDDAFETVYLGLPTGNSLVPFKTNTTPHTTGKLKIVGIDAAYISDKQIALVEQLTNGSVTKLGTGTIGSGKKLMYLDAGTPTSSTFTIGGEALPVYLNSGTITECTPASLFSDLSNSGNDISVTVAGLSKTLQVGYADKAGKLAATRTIWGHDFDGGNNVSGDFDTGGHGDFEGYVSSMTLLQVGAYGAYFLATTQALTVSVASTFKNNITISDSYALTVGGSITSGGSATVGGTATVGNLSSKGYVTSKASSSDIRLKTDIQSYSALGLIRNQRSVRYHWNAAARANNEVFNTSAVQYGLIAQELQTILPQFVKDPYGDYLTIDYERLIPICWRGIQEVDDEVTLLQRRVAWLEKKLSI